MPIEVRYGDPSALLQLALLAGLANAPRGGGGGGEPPEASGSGMTMGRTTSSLGVVPRTPGGITSFDRMGIAQAAQDEAIAWEREAVVEQGLMEELARRQAKGEPEEAQSTQNELAALQARMAAEDAKMAASQLQFPTPMPAPIRLSPDTQRALGQINFARRSIATRVYSGQYRPEWGRQMIAVLDGQEEGIMETAQGKREPTPEELFAQKTYTDDQGNVFGIDENGAPLPKPIFNRTEIEAGQKEAEQKYEAEKFKAEEAREEAARKKRTEQRETEEAKRKAELDEAKRALDEKTSAENAVMDERKQNEIERTNREMEKIRSGNLAVAQQQTALTEERQTHANNLADIENDRRAILAPLQAEGKELGNRRRQMDIEYRNEQMTRDRADRILALALNLMNMKLTDYKGNPIYSSPEMAAAAAANLVDNVALMAGQAPEPRGAAAAAPGGAAVPTPGGAGVPAPASGEAPAAPAAPRPPDVSDFPPEFQDDARKANERVPVLKAERARLEGLLPHATGEERREIIAALRAIDGEFGTIRDSFRKALALAGGQ
ncbi:MAG: hypothetical protein ABII00_06755 [Elusimicrobiota bacterium]